MTEIPEWLENSPFYAGVVAIGFMFWWAVRERDKIIGMLKGISLGIFKDNEKIELVERSKKLELENAKLQGDFTELQVKFSLVSAHNTELEGKVAGLEKKALHLKGYQSFFHVSNVPHIITTVDGRIKEVNACFAAAFGWEPSELEGKKTMTFFYYEDQEPALRSRQRLIDGGTVRPFEARFLCHNGAYKTAKFYPAKNGDFYTTVIIKEEG